MVPWNKNVSDAPADDAVEGDLIRQDEHAQKKQAFVAEDDIAPQPKKSEVDNAKETFRLHVGSYDGTLVPLAILSLAYTCGAIAVAPMTPDARTKDWPLMQSSLPSLAMCVVYILFSIVWGPRMMQHRDPFKLNKVMIVYNAVQVVYSLYMFFEVGITGWFFNYNYFCQPCDYSFDPIPFRTAKVSWWFFLSKILDFADTIFFVLHKKFTHISMLHVVHHSCMVMSMWYGIRYSPGGHITFMGFLNSGVHAIMYTYYLLSAFGPKLRPYLWWKKYLTAIQLVQFVAIFIHAAQLLFFECHGVPIGLAVWTCIYAFIFFALFIDYFYREYIMRGKKRAPSAGWNMCFPNLSHASEAHVSTKPLANGHIRSPSTLTFRIDSCLRERQTLK